MENNPIQTMLDEHEIISSAESIIKKLDGMWENDIDTYRTTIHTLVTFFTEYADGYHHRKEEEVLFPAIKNHPEFILEEMVDELEQHHEEFRDYAREILEHLESDEDEKAYKILDDYLEDLLDHIGAENDELFITAETLLSEEELETIYFKFKDIDMELGEEQKTELEGTLESLPI